MSDPQLSNKAPVPAPANRPRPERAADRPQGKRPKGLVDAPPRPAGEVRGKILRTVDEATDLRHEILRGRYTQEIRDRGGAVVGHRRATIKEVAAVYRCLSGHALPKQREEVVRGDGRTMQEIERDEESAQAERVRVANAWDTLTDEELAWAMRINEKVEAHLRS